MSERQEKRSQFEQTKKRGVFPWIVAAVAVVAVAAGVVGWTAASSGKGGKYPLVRAEGGPSGSWRCRLLPVPSRRIFPSIAGSIPPSIGSVGSAWSTPP